MYYIDGQKILDILLCQVFDENTIDNILVNKKMISEITPDKKYLDIAPVIFNTKKPINKNSIKVDDNYHTNISVSDMFRIVEGETYSSYAKKMCKHVPKEILDLYKIDNNTTKLANIVQCKQPIERVMYRNSRDSLLYLSDLNKLDYNISRYIGSMKVDILRKLFSMEFRLIIPKFVYNEIVKKCECRSNIYVYKDEKHKISMLKYNDPNEKPLHNERLNTLYEIVRDLTHNGKDNLDLLPDCTLYTCYFSMNFENLNILLNEVSSIEEGYYGQVLGAIYYNIVHFPAIKYLFKLTKETEDGINRRIHRRVGN